LSDLTLRKFFKEKIAQLMKSTKDECLEETNKIRKSFNEEEIKFQYIPDIYVMHDHLRLFSDSESYRFLKLRAEARMCEALALGYLILALINLFLILATIKSINYQSLILEFIAITFVILFYSRAKRNYYYYFRGTCRTWLLVASPIKKFKQEIPNFNHTD
jgi:hypothetical protein